MTRKPTLRNKRGALSIFDYLAAETVSVAPYRPGDVVRYRRSPRPSPSGDYYSQAHGIGVISARGARGEDYDKVIYSVYDGRGYASMLQAEHLELLLRPSAQTRRCYSYRAIFDLALGPGMVGADTWALCSDARRLWIGLDHRLRPYVGLEYRYEQDAAQRLRISRIQRRAELRALRRLQAHNRIVDTTIPRIL